METITIKIDKRTKIGKNLLGMIEHLAANTKSVKLKKQTRHTQSDLKPEVLESMGENDKKGMKNLKSFDTSEKLFEDLGI